MQLDNPNSRRVEDEGQRAVGLAGLEDVVEQVKGGRTSQSLNCYSEMEYALWGIGSHSFIDVREQGVLVGLSFAATVTKMAAKWAGWQAICRGVPAPRIEVFGREEQRNSWSSRLRPGPSLGGSNPSCLEAVTHAFLRHKTRHPPLPIIQGCRW